MFTKGFELTTALTNVIIFIVSVFCVFKTKEKGLWKFFFFCLIIDSFMGSFIHGIVLDKTLIDALWVILAFFFTLTINTLLCIFLRCNYFHIISLSVLLSILMFIEMVFDMDYLLTFTYYALLILAICTIYLIKDKYSGMGFILISFLCQLIGGLLLLFKAKFFIVDHNGIYHLFMALTLVFIYLGINKKYKLCYIDNEV